MISIKKILNKISEKGVKGSFYVLFLKIYRPIIKIIVRRKFLKTYKCFDDKPIKNIFYKSFIKEIEKTKDVFSFMKNRKRPNFFFNLNEKKEMKVFFKSVYKTEMNSTIENANSILNNNFSELYPGYPDFKKKIEWRRDLITKNEWPLDFYMDLDTDNEKFSDIRQLWEINRHQYFVTLGKAYLFSDDEKYAKKFVELITDWIDHNPCAYSINWLHSQETAIRMVSWIWALYFFAESKSLTENHKKKILQNLYLHAEYTFWNLSNGLITHNHLISEICGLAICAIMFPEFKNSKKWLKKGMKIYQRELLKQIWEEGPSAELSTNYHLFVLESIIQLFTLIRKNQIVISNKCENRIEKMIEYVMFLCFKDGSIPKVGDNDSGRAVKLSDYNTNDRRGVLSTGAVLFNRGDFKFISKKFYEETFWLLGIGGFRHYSYMQEYNPDISSVVYEKPGLAVFKNLWTRNAVELFIRSGPTSKRQNVSFSHNHSDFLSFNLSINGNNILIDPGTYLYNLSDKWRFYFRKTFCHNTVVIDGKDQFNVSKTRFGIPDLPLAKINNFDTSNQIAFIDFEHNCYSDIEVKHRRKLLLYKDVLINIDEVTGSGKHLVEQIYNVGENSIKINESNDLILINNKKSNSPVMIFQYSDKKLNYKLKSGNTFSIKEWYSPEYGEIKPTNIISSFVDDVLPVQILSVFVPSSSRIQIKSVNISEDKYEVDVTEDNEVTRLVVLPKGKVYIFAEEEITL